MTSKAVSSLGAALLATTFVLAGCDRSNGCEEALRKTTDLTNQICAEGAYKGTPFCKTCVAAGYLSTTGPTDCRCTLLVFDQAVCAFPEEDEAKSEIRGAIVWA